VLTQIEINRLALQRAEIVIYYLQLCQCISVCAWHYDFTVTKASILNKITKSTAYMQNNLNPGHSVAHPAASAKMVFIYVKCVDENLREFINFAQSRPIHTSAASG